MTGVETFFINWLGRHDLGMGKPISASLLTGKANGTDLSVALGQGTSIAPVLFKLSSIISSPIIKCSRSTHNFQMKILPITSFLTNIIYLIAILKQWSFTLLTQKKLVKKLHVKCVIRFWIGLCIYLGTYV